MSFPCPYCRKAVPNGAVRCPRCTSIIQTPQEASDRVFSARVGFVLLVFVVSALYYCGKHFELGQSNSADKKRDSPGAARIERHSDSEQNSSTDVIFTSQRTGPIRELTVAVRIDGEDALKIRDGRLWFEHISAMKHVIPQNILLNGTPWEPSWAGRVSSSYADFPAPLAPFKDSNVSVTHVSGRSTVRVDLPSDTNDQTLTVGIADYPVGSDENVILIKW